MKLTNAKATKPAPKTARASLIPPELIALAEASQQRQIDQLRERVRSRQQPDWETTREELRRRRQAEKRLPPC